MSTPPPSDRAALGRERLAARAARLSRLRRRVAAATLATFALAWGAIAWDGSMGRPATASTAQVTASSSSSATSSDDSASTASSDDGQSLTTSQS